MRRSRSRDLIVQDGEQGRQAAGGEGAPRPRPVIPNVCEGSPRQGIKERGDSSRSPLARFGMTEERRHAPTSPRWDSCAASSKCSCKQAFLLASDGMTEERDTPCSRTLPRWGSCAASSKCSCKQAFLLASGGMTGEGCSLPCPPCDCPTKMRCIFAGALFGGTWGGLSMQSAARAGQSLSHFVTAPFTQGSLSSCHPEHGTQWSGGIPLQVIEGEGIPRFADFAPFGIVRRFVEMLLQAGIPPRVGRHDGGGGARPRPLTSPRWDSCAASSKCSLYASLHEGGGTAQP